MMVWIICYKVVNTSLDVQRMFLSTIPTLEIIVAYFKKLTTPFNRRHQQNQLSGWPADPTKVSGLYMIS